MFYTNRSTITKTFHGVTFRPGETKEVFGIINDPKMAISSTRQEPPKCDRSISSETEAKSTSEDSVAVEKPTRRRATKSVESVADASTTSESENPENMENKEVLESGTNSN